MNSRSARWRGRSVAAIARAAASIGYSTRRQLAVQAARSTSSQAARGSPSRGWPTLPGLSSHSPAAMSCSVPAGAGSPLSRPSARTKLSATWVWPIAPIRGEYDVIGFEMFECRSIFKGDWKLLFMAPPYGNNEWSLFNLREDPRELVDLKDREPAKFAELKAEWDAYAAAVGYIEAGEIKQLDEMSPEDFFQYIGLDQADAPGTNVGEKLSAMSDSIDRISAANASLLKGEIPADVASAVRRAASESSIVGGIFGSSARNLSARDLGKTSVDIKQQGISNESALLQSRNELAASYEAIRQYNLTRNTALANLSLESRKLNLSAIEQERMRIATNIDANIKILGYIAEMAIQQQNIAASAAANEINPSNIISSLDRMMAEFNEQLS